MVGSPEGGGGGRAIHSSIIHEINTPKARRPRTTKEMHSKVRWVFAGRFREASVPPDDVRVLVARGAAWKTVQREKDMFVSMKTY